MVELKDLTSIAQFSLGLTVIMPLLGKLNREKANIIYRKFIELDLFSKEKDLPTFKTFFKAYDSYYLKILKKVRNVLQLMACILAFVSFFILLFAALEPTYKVSRVNIVIYSIFSIIILPLSVWIYEYLLNFTNENIIYELEKNKDSRERIVASVEAFVDISEFEEVTVKC